MFETYNYDVVKQVESDGMVLSFQFNSNEGEPVSNYKNKGGVLDYLSKINLVSLAVSLM
jgi:hypothetical protein